MHAHVLLMISHMHARRYYVLLAGRDEDNEDAADDHGIILDVKFEPEPAVRTPTHPPRAHKHKHKCACALFTTACLCALFSLWSSMCVHGRCVAVQVLAVLDSADVAWYHNQFGNEAQRAVLAQRALTSYTDPYARARSPPLP